MGDLVRRRIRCSRLWVKGQISIAGKDNPFSLAPGESMVEIYANSSVAALGSQKVFRLRGNINVDATGTTKGFRVLDIEARAAENIGTLEAINIDGNIRSGAAVDDFHAIMFAPDVVADAGTIAKLTGLKMDFRMKKAPTYSAGIVLISTDTYSPHYGIDMTEDYSLNPTKADLRLSQDVCIFSGAGAPTNGVTGAGYAGPGSIYIDRTSAVGMAYINTNTKASPTWTKIGAQT